jgi:hypothetical protein
MPNEPHVEIKEVITLAPDERIKNIEKIRDRLCDLEYEIERNLKDYGTCGDSFETGLLHSTLEHMFEYIKILRSYR